MIFKKRQNRYLYNYRGQIYSSSGRERHHIQDVGFECDAADICRTFNDLENRNMGIVKLKSSLKKIIAEHFERVNAMGYNQQFRRYAANIGLNANLAKYYANGGGKMGGRNLESILSVRENRKKNQPFRFKKISNYDRFADRYKNEINNLYKKSQSKWVTIPPHIGQLFPAFQDLMNLANCDEQVTDLTAGERCNFADTYVVGVDEDIEIDWNAYSKTWHRQYGAKQTTYNRRVIIYRKLINDRSSYQFRVINLEGYRGNWMLNSLMSVAVLYKNTVPNDLRRVQVHPAFQVSLIRSLGSVNIYERKIGHDHYDYCAVYDDVTYHAETLRGTIAGLREKYKNQLIGTSGIIDLNLARSLGFCEEGIRQFCRDFDLKISGHYTPDELKSALRDNPGVIHIYENELRTLANAVNVPESL